MAYTKFNNTWQDAPSQQTPIIAAALNHIETGIYNAASVADSAKSVADSAYSGLDDKADATALDDKVDKSNILTYEQTMQIFNNTEGE